MDGSAIASKLNLDQESREILENLASAQCCSLDEYISGLVRKAIRGEQRTRRQRNSHVSDAPMDAFLPEGVDPFAINESSALASSFAEVQTRMRFAGTPSLFRDSETN